MSLLVVHLAGLADVPGPVLQGRTPLQCARTPALDAFAREGCPGLAELAADDDGDGAALLLSLLGYDPRRDPLSRASLEARALGVEVRAAELVLRLTFASMLRGEMVDLRAHPLRAAEASELLAALHPALPAGWVLHEGREGRHLLVAPVAAQGPLRFRPPQRALGASLDERDVAARAIPGLQAFLARAEAGLAAHDINRVRVDLGENPADRLWPWSPGSCAELMPFALHAGASLAVVSSAPIATGLAAAVEASLVGPAALEAALAQHEIVLWHVATPEDLPSAGADDPLPARLRVRLIEELDRTCIAPLLERNTSMLLLTDPPPGSTGFPFLLRPAREAARRGARFTEAAAQESGLRVEATGLLALARRAVPSVTMPGR